jgi:hypothetical protein
MLIVIGSLHSKRAGRASGRQDSMKSEGGTGKFEKAAQLALVTHFSHLLDLSLAREVI